MEKENLRSLIVSDRDICHGKPILKGTRVMVWQILELLENGKTKGDIYAAYPSLPDKSVEASLEYATNKVKETSLINFSNE